MRLLRAAGGRILVESHRGAERVAPPNSWSALLAAVEGGADLIEVDLRLSADGVPVIYHDFRAPGGTPFRALPAAAIATLDAGDGRPPPTLDALLEWLESQPAVGLTLDVKNDFGHGIAPFAALLERLRGSALAERVMVGGFDHIGLLWLRRHEPAITTRAFVRAIPIDLVAMARRAEVSAVSLSYDLASRADVDALHEAGIAVALAEMWEPNFRYAVELGVDIVSWGDPAEARFALDALTASEPDVDVKP